jgi:hypothetical protein
MPEAARAAARFQLNRLGIRQDDFARAVDLSRPQFVNLLQGRFGASSPTVARITARLHDMEARL